MPRRLLLSLLLLVLALPVIAEEWTPAAVMRLKILSEPRVSPDGTRIAWVAGETLMTDEKSEVLRHIWIAKTDGSDVAQLTFGDKSSTSPEWLPDGSGLVFISKRGGKNHLYRLKLRGGEAEPLMDAKAKLEVGSFAIAPDGNSVAFTASDVREDEEKRTKAKEDYRWVDERDRPRRLYVLPLAKDAKGMREPRKIAGGEFHVGSIDWSPDAKWIAFARAKSAGANDWPTSDLVLVDVANGTVKPLAATKAAEESPVFSPDGQWVAIEVSQDPPTWGGVTNVQLVRVATGERKDLASTYDVNGEILGFSGDGKRIYVRETRGTVDRIYAIDVAANKVVDVDGGTQGISEGALNANGTWLSFLGQSASTAPEIYVTRLDKYAPVNVSRANEGFPAAPKTEVVKWKSSDGLEIEGLLTYPLGYREGQKVPMVLVIHGGPAGVWKQNYTGNYSPFPVAVFAQRGYAVLRPNPRGSSGYGQKFRYANYNDWGGGDYQDLMTGVDHVVAKGVADPDKLAVTGWSYGGFMTSWVITHTKRFKAAVVGAGVTNLLSFTGTADISGFLPDYFGGHFWDRYDVWKEHSPIVHVKGATTPTLIVHGEADDRVPISQGYELYNALQIQEVPTRMLVLPRQAHGITEPKMRQKAMEAVIDWLDKYLPK
jgi:dipeptidyl aminopeptidase/acylaminoacyl peptidase